MIGMHLMGILGDLLKIVIDNLNSYVVINIQNKQFVYNIDVH